VLEWIWHNVPGGVVGLCAGLAIGFMIYRYVLLRTTMDLNRRWQGQIAFIKREHAKEAAEYRQAYIDIVNEIDVRVEQRLKEWWPDPKDMDAAWLQAEQMSDKRKRIDSGRKTDVRTTEGPPSKIHRITLKKGK